MIKIWADERINKLVNFHDLDSEFSTDIFSNIIKKYIKNASRYDILILPFFPSYIEIILKIRARGFLGIITVILSNTETIFQPENTIINQILAININKLGKSYTIKILNLLLKKEKLKLEFYKKFSLNQSDDIEKIDNIKPILNILDKKNYENTKIIEKNELIKRISIEKIPILLNIRLSNCTLNNPTIELSGLIIDYLDHGFLTIGELNPKLNLKKLLKLNNITLSFNFNNKFLYFTSAIMEIEKYSIKIIQPTKILKNKRKKARYQYKNGDKFSLLIKYPNEQTTKMIPFDLSESGLSFITKATYTIDSTLLISITIDSELILTSGKILRINCSEDYNKYGVEIFPHLLDSYKIARYTALKLFS